jgi:hypothetical protein
MIRSARVLGVLFFSVASASSVPTLAAMGRTSGEFNVSQAGTAEYRVPLWTPSAAGGMRPQLSVNYSHVRENGLLGMGFEIAGFSVITRCPKTIAQDGADDRVKHDASDVFCLDGARLRLESGTYGVAESTYRTEIESFARIQAKSIAGSGPAWFEVRKRDGLIYEYGASSDSRIDFGLATPRAWAINSIRDRAGNRIDFTYHEDAVAGSFRPNTINYATNVAAGVGTAPYQVLFVYEPANRPDPIRGFYPAGGPEDEVKRLQEIQVRYLGAAVKIYRFTYEPSGGAGSRSRLSTLQECSTSLSDCLAATQFTWTNGAAALLAEQNPSQSSPTPLYLIDVDGDGRDDMVYTSHATAGSGTWRIRKANATGGFDSEINTGISNVGYLSAMALEWDGDGLTDILVPFASNQWHVLRATGSGFAAPWNTGIAVSGRQVAMDFDGDGRDDLVRMTTSGAASLHVRYRGASNFGSEVQLWTTGDPNFTFADFFPTPWYRYRSRIREADFNGDTVEDFLCWMRYYDAESQQYADYVARCLKTGFEVINSSTGGTDLGGNYTYADLNDDGLTDVLWTYFSGGTGILFGGSGSPVSGPTMGGVFQFVIFDYDGDGRDDILMEAGGSVPLKYYRSTGSGFEAPVNTPYTYPAATTLLVGDLNGDIYSDLVSAGTIRYRLHDPNPSDLLQSATDGFGVSVTFSYAQMTDASVYTKGSGAVYPKMDFKGARPLVKQVTATDVSGNGTTFTLTYTYEAARRELTGRGYLGFAKRTVVDSRLGQNLRNEQSYLQDWPLTGMVSTDATKQSNGSIIVETSNLWNALTYDTGNRQRKYPYVYSSSTQERELDNVQYRTIAHVLPGSLGASGIDSVSGLITDMTVTTTEAGSTGLFTAQSKTERVTNTVFNQTGDWCIGRPDTTTWENDLTLGGVAPITRVLDRSWDGLYCRLTTEVVEPFQPTWTVTKAYLYDDFGNIRRETVTGAGMTPRVTNIGWGVGGQYPVTITNPLGQTTTIGYNFGLGTRTSVLDPNGVQVSWSHDNFGRTTLESRPDGSTSYSLSSPGGFDVPRAKYLSTATFLASGGAQIRQEVSAGDQFDRAYYESRQQSSGSGYAWSNQQIGYDVFGRVERQYTPWLAGVSPAGCWKFEYDTRHRLTAGRLYNGCIGSAVRSRTMA